jgi:hypothetical protein
MYFLTIFGGVSLARRAYTSIADGATIGKVIHHPPTLIRVEAAYIIFSWVHTVSVSMGFCPWLFKLKPCGLF